jgi:hypothetical protein
LLIRPDRQRVVAELREPMTTTATTDPLLTLAERSVVRLPAAAERPLPKSPVRLPGGTSERIVDELGRERSDSDE